MAAPVRSDRSWTIAPTLAFFGVFLAGSLWAVDGGFTAVADRLTHKREADPSAGTGVPGVGTTAANVEVADASDDEPAALPVGGAGKDRAKGGALEDTCLEGTPDACKRWAMDAFYDSVAKTQSGKLGRAARVSWYGDSVIAADTIPARLRGKLQADWGDGGPGYVFVVEPHRFCFHEAITRSHTGTWLTHAISTLPAMDGMYGAGGASAEATGGAGATFKILNGKASRVELYYMAQPNGGTATVLADNNEIATADTSSDTKVGKGVGAKIDGGSAKFSIATKGRVRLFGLGLENDKGVVVDNFGIVSVNVKNFATRQKDNWEAELKHRAADLMIISIGANEAHWLGPKDTATKLYSGQFKAMLEPIRAARPDASCLVISPLDQAVANDSGYESRPVMPVIVQAQRDAAKAAGCAFFAAYDWQGGKGSAVSWFKKGLVGSDFIHLSKKGATKLADAVYQALTAGYHEHVGH